MANEVKLKLSMEGGKVVAAEIDGVSKNLSEMDHQANLAAVGMKALTTATGGFTVAMALGKLVSVQREFDVLNSSLVTVTGSSTAAAREMAWIKGFAKETPFGLAQATQGFVKMKALGLDPTRASLTSFGNTASAMGKDLNQMIEAVADASTGEFERLKEFGIKAKQSGDQVSLTFQGVTTTIGNSSNEITAYLEALGNNQFSGAMAERAKTLDGAIAGLGDTWDELFRTVNTNNAGGFIYDSVIVATKAIEDVITVMDAMNGATKTNAKETGAMATVQEALALTFERVSIGAATVKMFLVETGKSLGALAAIAVQAVQGNWAGVKAIVDEQRSSSRTAMDDLATTTTRILSARKDATVAAEVNATANARLARQGIESDERAISSAGKSSATKQKLTAEQKLVNDGMALYNDLLDIGSGYTATYAEDQRKLAAAFKSGLIPSYAQYTAAVEILMARQPGMVAREKEHAKVIAESARSYESSAKAALKYNADLANNNEALENSNAKLAEENALMGLSEESKARLTLARMDAAIATAQEAFALLDLQNSSEIEIATAQRRIDLMKEQRALSGQGIMVKEAMATAAEWKKTADSIRDSLTDAFMSAIDGTKSLWVALRDSVVGMFKNMVLRPLVQGVIGAGVSAVAGSAAAGALGFGGSAAGAAAGASMSGGITSLLGSSSMGALDIMGFDPTTLAIGAAILVLSQMGGKFVSAADSGRARVDYSSAGIGGAAYNTTGDASQIKGANKRVESLAESYFTTAAALGISAMQATFEVGSNTGKEGAAPMTVLGVNIGKTGYSSGEVSSGDAVALQLAASRALMTALQASELPEYLRGAFDGLTASAMTQDEINQTLTSAQSVKAFHEAVQALPFESVKNLSYQATINLANASGGLDTLQASLTNMATASAAAKDGIKGLVSGISASVDKTLWDMQYGMADNKGKYGMLDVRGATLDQQMHSATDINEIAKYGNAEIANIIQSWGLLSAEQQAASYAQYETILNGIEEYISGKGDDALALQQAKDDQTAATIATAVEAAVAKSMASSAAAMQAAADKVDKPVVVNSHISVSVSAPAGFEVNTAGGSQ